MSRGDLYTDYGPGLERLEDERLACKELLHDLNHIRPRDVAERERLLRRLLGSAGERVWFEQPFRCSYGFNVHVGDDFYANFQLCLVDDVEIRFGDRVMIAPQVTIATTGHPVHADLRAGGTQFSQPVTVGDDVWIGSNAVVLPGVSIGAGTVVGAGSVVTRSVPSGVVAAGSPARIVRVVTDADREFRPRPVRELEHP